MTRDLIATFGVALMFGALACSADKGNTGDPSGSGGASGSGGSAGGTGGTTGSGGASSTGGTSGSGGSGSGGSSGAGGVMADASADLPPAADAPPGGPANAKMSFFITSEKSTTGNLGGIAMADARCQRLATVAGAGGKTWKAYLSTATENARMRIGTGPWFNFKGEMIAQDLMQLHEEGGMKSNLTQQTGLTDTGKIVSGRNVKNPGEGLEHDVLTGSLRDGMVKANAHCNNWTAATGASGVGHCDRLGIQPDPVVAASWNDAHNGQCADTAPGGGAGRYYCFATN